MNQGCEWSKTSRFTRFYPEIPPPVFEMKHYNFTWDFKNNYQNRIDNFDGNQLFMQIKLNKDFNKLF